MTVFSEEPFTCLFAGKSQADLGAELREYEAARLAREPHARSPQPDSPPRMAILAADLRRRTADGKALGHLELVTASADLFFVHGVDASAPQNGPDGIPGRFPYEVRRTVKARPDQVISNRGGELVLTTCDPVYSTESRLVVIARLTRAEPLGLATSN